MRVLHLDMPRGLSVTLREWNGSCHHALAGEWRQIDLNFDFWAWLIRDGETDLFGRIVDMHYQTPDFSLEVLRSVKREIASRGAALECRLSLEGTRFSSRALASGASLRDFARTTRDRDFFDSYFQHLCQKFMLLSAQSVLSLGVDSPDGLVFAALLADFVRRTDPDIRICLTKHQYENYSLVGRMDELVAEGAIFDVFDAIVHFAEMAGEALQGLEPFFDTGDETKLTNVAVRSQAGPKLFPAGPGPTPTNRSPVDAKFVRDTEVPPDRLVYFTSIGRKACYYARCSFCTQNEQYLDPHLHEQDPGISHALDTVSELSALGVRSFSFSDQALHPKTLRALSDALIERDAGISWCGRALFNPRRIDDDLAEALRTSGCREILFGLESFRRETLQAMRKDFGWNVAQAHELLERLERHRIDVVLNLMFGFPAETDPEFEEGTWTHAQEVLRRRANVTVILNRFSLFRDTEMAHSPEAFGIADISAPNGVFDPELDYLDVHGRDSRSPHPRERAYRDMLAQPLRDRLGGEDAATLTSMNYTSIGLGFRWKTGKYLTSAVSEESPGDGPFVSTGGRRRDVLIVGANAYIGQNLVQALDPASLILSSRSARNDVIAAVKAPFIRADLTRFPQPLAVVSPREVYVVARPTDGFPAQAEFAKNLKSQLFDWAGGGLLKRIVFLSTQLVYPTPQNGVAATTADEIGPVGVYEYFKADLEGFLKYAALKFAIDAEVFRLPLVFGGAILPSQNEEQLIYAWIDEMNQGARWSFKNDEERGYGNSWVWMPDLVESLVRPRGPGFHLRQPASGNFTYAQIQGALAHSGPHCPSLRLIRSRFFLKDEEGLPARDLAVLLRHAAREL